MNFPANQPKVAIVIVNWNKKEHILSLLESLNHIDYKSYDVVVVDNASTDGSAEAVSQHYPEITLIVNKENLGGTGGFNTGMKYALSKDEYKYIWLLDNDAEVENDTLSELVRVMEEDNKVGIAGSMMLNPDNRDYIVNVGLGIDQNSGIVKSLFENQLISEVRQGVYVVDCVPACSAIVRVESLKKTSLMDPRYFIFWDDIDLCFNIRKLGYKVVSVSRSKVYHPTEKFWALAPYYNHRNSLLTYSKYVKLVKRVKFFHRIASYLSKAILFSSLAKNNYLSKVLFYSARDYLLDNWGKFDDSKIQDIKTNIVIKSCKISYDGKILILPTANITTISKSIDLIKKYNRNAHITLVIQKHRMNLFENIGVDKFITYDEQKRFNFFQHLSLFARILIRNFDMAVMPDDQTDFPFGYAAKKYYAYSVDDNNIRFKGTRSEMWKVFVASLFGELIAIPLTAALLLKSLKYSKESSVVIGPK